MLLNYDEELNELHIYGCLSCPFCEKEHPLGMCEITREFEGDPFEDRFPESCPLRDPNFKLVRHMD